MGCADLTHSVTIVTIANMSYTDARRKFEEEKNRRAQLIIYYAVTYPDWSLQDISNAVADKVGECNKVTVKRVLDAKGITRK